MSIWVIFKLLGSLALLMFGMKSMSEALQKMAGPQLRHVLGAMTTNRFTGMLTGTLFAFATALGFGLALILFAGLREQLALNKVPKAMQGTPIALLTAGLLAMAFMGFSGVV